MASLGGRDTGMHARQRASSGGDKHTRGLISSARPGMVLDGEGGSGGSGGDDGSMSSDYGGGSILSDLTPRSRTGSQSSFRLDAAQWYGDAKRGAAGAEGVASLAGVGAPETRVRRSTSFNDSPSQSPRKLVPHHPPTISLASIGEQDALEAGKGSREDETVGGEVSVVVPGLERRRSATVNDAPSSTSRSSRHMPPPVPKFKESMLDDVTEVTDDESERGGAAKEAKKKRRGSWGIFGRQSGSIAEEGVGSERVSDMEVEEIDERRRKSVHHPTAALRAHVKHLRLDVELLGRCFLCGEVGHVHKGTCCSVQRHLACEMDWQRRHRHLWTLVEHEEVSASGAGEGEGGMMGEEAQGGGRRQGGGFFGASSALFSSSTTTTPTTPALPSSPHFRYFHAPKFETDEKAREYFTKHVHKLSFLLPCSTCGEPWHVVQAAGRFCPLLPSEEKVWMEKMVEEGEAGEVGGLGEEESERIPSARGAVSSTTSVSFVLGWCFQDVFGCASMGQLARFLGYSCGLSGFPLGLLICICIAVFGDSSVATFANLAIALFVAMTTVFLIAILWRAFTVAEARRELAQAHSNMPHSQEDGLAQVAQKRAELNAFIESSTDDFQNKFFLFVSSLNAREKKSTRQILEDAFEQGMFDHEEGREDFVEEEGMGDEEAGWRHRSPLAPKREEKDDPKKRSDAKKEAIVTNPLMLT